MWGKAMIPAKLNHFPLNRAYLCQDCNEVGNDATHCPACASQALMGLAQVFDRAEAKQAQEMLLFPVLAADAQR